MTSASPTPPAVRASNREREATVTRLHHALGAGCLDLEETETRVAAAYAATLRDELPPLIADLPDDDGAPRASWAGDAPPSWRTMWTGLVWRARAGLWDASDASRAVPPSEFQLRLAALIVLVATFWVMVAAVLGAML